MKKPEESSLSKLPPDKKALILKYQFAFITFKDFNSAERVTDELPYFKLNDDDFNIELQILSRLLNEQKIVDVR